MVRLMVLGTCRRGEDNSPYQRGLLMSVMWGIRHTSCGIYCDCQIWSYVGQYKVGRESKSPSLTPITRQIP
ncbi:hypothetical protein J6590_061563 [Homalodisca vitripennis]|nr:hypothetical protein J6590_061563 [Homalodisca vitripennis]